MFISWNFNPAAALSPLSRRLRVDTLVRLRWLAVAGQSAAVIVVHMGLGFELPLTACFMMIAASALLNIALRLHYPINERLKAGPAAGLLAFDVLQLTALLALTGGLQNPFAIMFLAPVLISATSLPPVLTLALGLITIACASALTLFYLPLPWVPGTPLELPFLYIAGKWFATLLAVAFIGIFAWRVAEEARQLSDALAATELVLAREQHLSALDGLAAAAAHEFGTPLATIALVVKELERDLSNDSPIRDDIVLLREQVDRCRGILKTLTSLNEEGAPHEHMSLSHLLEEVAAPHRHFGVNIAITAEGDPAAEPVVRRNAGLLYGLGNLVENAVDFAGSRVHIKASWAGDRVQVSISDDGPGFPPDILGRIGEPYVTTRAERRPDHDETGGAGLGLGVFIAKTLLERWGAAVEFINASAPEAGAIVRVSWPAAKAS